MSSSYLFEVWTAIQIVMVVGLVLIAIRSRSSEKKKYPPVVGAWMVVRDLVLFKDKVPHRTFYQWAKCYGPVYSVRTGFSSAVVVLNSAKAARQAMTEHHSSITAKNLTTALKVLSLDQTMVALSDYGRDHRLMKKLMVSHLLGTTPQRNNAFMREEMVQKLITSVYLELKEACNDTVNMSKIILDHLFPFALNQVIGKTVEPLYVEELGSEIVSVQDMYNLIVGDPGNAALEINWRDFLPFVNRWFPNKKLRKMLDDVTKRRSALVKALIRQERDLLASGKEWKGYLDMLLKEGEILSERQLETAIWEPVIESTTTSHVAMVWAFFNLAKHPHTQERLYKELEQVCGNKALEEEDLGKLAYLKGIFYETVRRHSPLPLVPLRIVHEDVEIDGYHVPAGWEILINIWGANNYEGEWKNSEEWRPERQLEFPVEEDIYRTMVFGAGNRLCAGWAQAVTIASLVIGRIVQNFELKMPTGHEEDYDTIINTGTHKQHPLFSILTPRNA
ncbi:ent-kaurene oxidase, chloroplastic [Cryptomeria japonica]|uniref:ent-kaurene oxidase, chloroplastic n=1 Tax=Cryptomeria japonica TaxID=3369 RepID=UPI0027D9EC47|nr:ent-kaurene oxidase, chloroplastic [Cryptomeria japonica]